MNKSKDAVVVAFLVVVIVFSFGSLVRTMMPSREVAQVAGAFLTEASFDPSADSMIYQQNFDNYTLSDLRPPCGSDNVGRIVDHSISYCTPGAGWTYDANVTLGSGHSGQGIDLHYDGTLGEIHAATLSGVGPSTGQQPTVVQYWAKYVGDPSYSLTSTDSNGTGNAIVQIKNIMLFHDSGTRFQIDLHSHQGGCPVYGPSYTMLEVIDQVDGGCNSTQPVGPFFKDYANGAWHRWTILYKPNSAPGARNGYARLWIDGILVIRIDKDACGVTPAGGWKPWCDPSELDAIYTDGISHLEWGANRTGQPSATDPTNVHFTMSIDDVQWWKVNGSGGSTPPPVTPPPPTPPPPIAPPSSSLPNNSYSTNFPNTEDPVSEGGVWVNGKTDGVDWSDVATNSGHAHGDQSLAGIRYNDPAAILKGTWGPTQTAQATVYCNNQNPNYYQEVELHLRSSISAHHGTGYEINYRCLKTSASYTGIARWNGALGDWTDLGDSLGSQYGVQTGDVVKATIISNVITAYINGVQVLQATDNTYATGNPGIGFNYGVGTTNADFGFTNFSATGSSGTTPPPPPPPPTTNTPPQGNFDGLEANGTTLYGWSFDSDNSSASNSVQIYVGGPKGSGVPLTTTLSANVSRPDVDSYFTISGNHGFEFGVPSSLQDGLPHIYYVYGVDLTDPSVTPQIGNALTLTVASPQAPPPPPPPPSAPTLTFSANPTNITSGQSTTLTWLSNNSTSCTATGGWSGASVNISGFMSFAPLLTTTYTITCTGAGGTIAKNVTVTVSTPPSTPPPSGNLGIGSSVTTTSNVKVRLQATTNARNLGIQHGGARGVIKNGPVSANGYTWWSVDFSKGADGWVDGEYLRTQ